MSSVEQIKSSIAALSPAEQSEVSAFLSYLRRTESLETDLRPEDSAADAQADVKPDADGIVRFGRRDPEGEALTEALTRDFQRAVAAAIRESQS